jgi:hypothetical protein
MKQRLLFPEDLPGRHHLMALHAPDEEPAIIAELLLPSLHWRPGPRCQPDNFTQEVIEPHDAFLFKGDLRSLLGWLPSDSGWQ